MRIYFAYLFVVTFSLYAWRNWRLSLYALILFTAVYQHEDMPRLLFGIPGLGTWNVMLVSILVAWAADFFGSARRLDIRSPLPALFAAYVFVTLIAGVRGALDLEDYAAHVPGGESTWRFVADNLVTPFKCMLPALLLLDACRTRRDVLWSCFCIGGFVIIDALLIMKRLSPAVLLGQANYLALRLRVGDVTGYHPNDMALMLVFTFWSIVGFQGALKPLRWLRAAALGGAAICALAIALCYSRGGFVAFIGVGLLLGTLGRTRIAFPILAVVILAGIASPTISSRAMDGVNESKTDIAMDSGQDALTAGRTTVIWPIVIDGIAEHPIVGRGREALRRSPSARQAMAQYGEAPTHPHNAYLEILLDGGVISFMVVMSLLGYLLFICVRLIRGGRDLLMQAVGKGGLAALGAWMIMGLTGQHFYSTENTIALLCVLAVVARVYADANDWLRLRSDCGVRVRSVCGPPEANGSIIASQCTGEPPACGGVKMCCFSWNWRNGPFELHLLASEKEV